MKRQRRRVALVGVLALLAAFLVVPAQPAFAQNTYEVQVSAFSQNAPVEGMGFYPNRLTVHPGDTLQFTSESFHTATLLPANVGAQDWIDDNATGVGAPWNLIAPDVDEPQPGNLKGNNRALFPTRQDCGAPGNPCLYDGTTATNDGGVLNSGVFVFGPPTGMSVTVDAAPGDFFWVICLVHTNMRMKVRVVGPAETASDPAAVQAEADDAIAQDLDNGEALFNKMINKRSFHMVNGKKVWDTFVGFETKDVTLFGMFPKRLKIQKGDKVRYHWDQLGFEIHTATFPKDQALDLVANDFFIPVCDPDGDGPGPDNPPETQDPPFCNDPSQLEFDITAKVTLPGGDGKVTSRNDFQHSGIRGFDAPDQPMDVRFPKASGRKGFGFLCVVHPDMRGKVIVKR